MAARRSTQAAVCEVVELPATGPRPGVTRVVAFSQNGDGIGKWAGFIPCDDCVESAGARERRERRPRRQKNLLFLSRSALFALS